MIKSNIATAGWLLAALTLAASPAAAAVSPFRALAGTWSGGGMLSMANGEQQRLRCRAAYDVAGRGDELNLNLRCASDAYNFDLTGNVAYRGGAISGQWGARPPATPPAPSKAVRMAITSRRRLAARISRPICR